MVTILSSRASTRLNTEFTSEKVPACVHDENNAGLADSKMMLTHDGLLGINTTTPGYTLDVNGSCIIRNRSFIGQNCPNTISDTSDALYLENNIASSNYTQLHMVYNDPSGTQSSAIISINKNGFTNGIGGTNPGLNIWTASNGLKQNEFDHHPR